MKKILFFIGLFLLLVSCVESSSSVDSLFHSSSHTEISAHEKCAYLAPFKNTSFNHIFWSFQNNFDQKCWYLGYISDNFFLTNGDDYTILWATGATLQETEERTGDWNLFEGREGNKLYADSVYDFFTMQNDVSERYFHGNLLEFVSFASYYPDTVGRFLKKFETYNITLPEGAVLTRSSHFQPPIISVVNQEETDTTSSLDIENLYHFLREKQKSPS